MTKRRARKSTHVRAVNPRWAAEYANPELRRERLKAKVKGKVQALSERGPVSVRSIQQAIRGELSAAEIRAVLSGP